MTNTIYYDQQIIDLLRDNVAFWRMAWVYRSNWRVLHIDGFERGHNLPEHRGKALTFFNYKEESNEQR